MGKGGLKKISKNKYDDQIEDTRKRLEITEWRLKWAIRIRNILIVIYIFNFLYEVYLGNKKINFFDLLF